MKKSIYNLITDRISSGRKALAVLIDPEKTGHLDELLERSVRDAPSFFFVGGTTSNNSNFESCIQKISKVSEVPVVIFPGDPGQISGNADAILLLSLISGRNPELLIGQHVRASRQLHDAGIEIIPTGYILIDGGIETSVIRSSKTTAISPHDFETASATAMAGEQLGMKLIYLEAGSGAAHPVPDELITGVRSVIRTPLIVGGGVRTGDEIRRKFNAGADIVVVGNILETRPELIHDFVQSALNHNQ